MANKLKREFIKLLEKDSQFKYLVAGYPRILRDAEKTRHST
jgi:hypothetical protein